MKKLIIILIPLFLVGCEIENIQTNDIKILSYGLGVDRIEQTIDNFALEQTDENQITMYLDTTGDDLGDRYIMRVYDLETNTLINQSMMRCKVSNNGTNKYTFDIDNIPQEKWFIFWLWKSESHKGTSWDYLGGQWIYLNPSM